MAPAPRARSSEEVLVRTPNLAKAFSWGVAVSPYENYN